MSRGIALAVLLVVVVAALYVPVLLPYDLVSVGSVTPSEEWKLTQDGAGNLVATHQNFRTGIVERMGSWQFSRGDLAGMEVTARPDSFQWVPAGDTVVRLYSALIQREMLDLETQIRVLEAQRSDLTTGEKVETVEEAEARLRYAQEALTLAEKQFAVGERLFKEGVTPELEYKTLLNNRDLARIAVETAQKTLRVVSTGVKPQTVQVNDSQVEALRRRLAQLRAQSGGYFITAPFAGVVAPVAPLTTEILVLQRVDECIVQIPVKVEEMRFIGDSTRIEIIDPISGKVYQATLLQKMPQTQVLSGRSVGFVQASIRSTHPGERIALGIAAQCSIHCGSLNQRDYLKRVLRFGVAAK